MKKKNNNKQLPVAIYFPGRGEGDKDRNFRGDEERERGDVDGERAFLN